MTTPPHQTRPHRMHRVGRRIGMVLCLAFLGLVVVGSLIREPLAGDRLHLIARWPLWLLLGVAGPLLAVRLVGWRRRRMRERPPPADTGA